MLQQNIPNVNTQITVEIKSYDKILEEIHQNNKNDIYIIFTQKLINKYKFPIEHFWDLKRLYDDEHDEIIKLINKLDELMEYKDIDDNLKNANVILHKYNKLCKLYHVASMKDNKNIIKIILTDIDFFKEAIKTHGYIVSTDSIATNYYELTHLLLKKQ